MYVTELAFLNSITSYYCALLYMHYVADSVQRISLSIYERGWFWVGSG